MPFIVYRCDLLEHGKTPKQALRFRASILSDTMNVQDEIDLTCAVGRDVLPLAKDIDAAQIDIAKIGQGYLSQKEMAYQVQEWITYQIERRRGTKYFVASRGDDHDLVNLNYLLETMDHGFSFFDLEKSLTLDIQDVAEDLLAQSKIDPDLNQYPSDQWAIESQEMAVPYLPFYMERKIPGSIPLPAFQSSIAVIAHIKKKGAAYLKSIARPITGCSSFSSRNSVVSVNDIIPMITEQGEKQMVVAAKIKVEHKEFTVLLDLDAPVNGAIKRLSQANLVELIHAGDSRLIMVESSAVPALPNRLAGAKASAELSARRQLAFKAFTANKRFQHNLKKVAIKLVDQKMQPRDKFNNAVSGSDTAETVDFVKEQGKAIHAAICLPFLKREKAPRSWITYEAAARDIRRLQRSLPASSAPYIKEWHAYLQSHEQGLNKAMSFFTVKDMRTKSARAKKTLSLS